MGVIHRTLIYCGHFLVASIGCYRYTVGRSFAEWVWVAPQALNRQLATLQPTQAFQPGSSQRRIFQFRLSKSKSPRCSIDDVFPVNVELDHRSLELLKVSRRVDPAHGQWSRIGLKLETGVIPDNMV